MNETMKVFLACALGAFIGTIVALEVNYYFWWLGLIAGGLVGYISYEFKKVITAIPVAWQKARGWQPDREYWQEYGKLFVTVVNSGLVIACPFSCFVVSLYSMSLGIVAISGMVFFFTGWVLPFMGAGSVSIEDARDIRAKLKLPFFLKIYFWITPKWTLKGSWWLLKGSWWLMKESPRFLVVVFWAVIASAIVVTEFTVRFGKALFREIHSDIRMLCGLDAAISTIIGYFSGSAIIGAIAGGLWGALNFEILSIRVLKLVPIEKSLLH